MIKMWPSIVLLSVVVLLAAGVWFWRFQTYHLATVKEGVLYRDGNRGMREYANSIRKVKPKVVVSLLDDQEMVNPDEPQFAREEKFLADNGIRLERVRVKLGGWPDAETLQRFMHIMDDPANHPVLVHCAQGVRRTGMFVAAYQCSVMGMDKDACRSAVLTFGHSRRSIGDIEKFIEVYDPEKRVMTQVLKQSKE